MELTVANWNIKGCPEHLRPRQLELIDQLAPDVLLLQELTPKSFDSLTDAGWSGAHALQLLPEGHRGRAKGKVVKFSCAVLARGSWQLTEPATNEEAPSPERWLTGRLVHQDAVINAGSFACPPGVDWGAMKTEQGRLIAQWMSRCEGAAIAGIDRNGPKGEHADGTVELWPPDAEELLGPDPSHPLHDVFITLLDRRPELREQAVAERPDGPLAVSYIRGRDGQKQTRSRYDAVYASDHFEVADVRYLYEEAIAAGSDHAVVVATVRLSKS